MFFLPKAPSSIKKGSSLKILLDKEAIDCLINNLSTAFHKLDRLNFKKEAVSGVKNLELMDRGRFLANLLYKYLPKPFSKAAGVILDSLTPELDKTERNGLEVFFYLPHTLFISFFGLDPKYNDNRDPFSVSMKAQYELTKRFTAEYSIRPFLIHEKERTFKKLISWLEDPSPHVRRLCTEGTRPRLPWAIRIPSLLKDPKPSLVILESLKDDPELYVRRSVANHLGDIAKDHPELVFRICSSWTKKASPERNWLIRHALRYPAKKNNSEAIRIRSLAK